MKMIIKLREKFSLVTTKWKPRPKLPRQEPVSVLDDIIRSDWYKPRDLKSERQNTKHTPAPDQA